MENSDKIIEDAIKILNKKYNDNSVIYGKAMAQKIEAIDTGCYSLNRVFDCGGVPRGRIIEIYGSESSGKTTMAMYLIGVIQKAGGKALFVDAEQAFSQEYAQKVGVDTEKLVISQPNCYDEETEVLTGSGWKLFKNLKKEKVYQVLDDGTGQFVKPLRHIKQYYSGKMVYFKNDRSRLDLLVTPNHRIVYRKNGLFQSEIAENIKFYSKKKIITTAETKNNEDVGLSAYEQFLIAFQADGSYPSISRYKSKADMGRICKHITVRFNFQKNRKTTRLIDICERAELSYKVKVEKSKKGYKTIYVEIPVSRVLSKTFDWVSPSRRSKKWCSEFIGELSYWDGTKRDNKHIKYDTTVEVNVDIAQQVSLFAGYSTVYTFTKMKNSKHRDLHTLNIYLYSREIEGQCVKKTIVEDWSGDVYCVTVPSSKLLVRRNKRVVVSGNSGEEGLDIVENMVKTGEFDIIVVDSVAALVPQKELDGDINDVTIALQARMMSRHLRVITGPIAKTKTCLIYINQTRDNLMKTWGSKTTTTGGKALKFYASVRLEVGVVSKIKGKNDSVIGNKLRIEAKKNKCGLPFRKAEIDLYFAEGIDIVGDVLDVAVEKGIVEKKGNTYMFGEIKLGVGRDSAREKLAEDQETFKKINKLINK